MTPERIGSAADPPGAPAARDGLADLLPSPLRQRAILVLLVILMTAPALWRRELIPTDEPRFALVARQMVEDPAPIVPHLGYDALTRQGDLYADKPPLFFWLISLFSFVTGGVNELSSRLPSLAGAIAAVLLTRRLGALLAGERAGFYAAMILATSNQFFLRAGWCSIDMLLTALVLAATDCWLRAARAPGEARGSRPLLLPALGGLFASTATLSKGPVGLIFPLVFLACDRAAAWRTDRAGTRRPRDAAMIATACAAFLLPIASWIAAIWAVAGRGYVYEILFHQNVTRYVAPWNNIAPWYYYFYRLPVGLLPWTLLLPAAILSMRGLPGPKARPLYGLLGASAVLFAFFSATTGKRGVYLLPIYPAIAILLAAGWLRTDSRLHRWSASAHVWTLFAAGLAGLVALPRVAARRDPALFADGWVLAAALAGAAVVSAILFARGRRGTALTAQVYGIAALVVLASVLLVPEVNRRSGLREFGRRLAAVSQPGDYVVVDQEGYEQILFYSRLNATRRDFERTRVTFEKGRVGLEPREPQREAGRRSPGSGAGASARPGPAEHASPTGRPDDAPGPPEPMIAGFPPPPVRFPAGARVLFVARESRVERLRAALGPSSRTLLAARLAGEPYFVIASAPSDGPF